MLCNARIAETLIAKAYGMVNDTSYSLAEVLGVIFTFVEQWEKKFVKPYPNTTIDTYKTIITAMPIVDEHFIKPIEYCSLVPLYFRQHFNDCDYALPHFFSGMIREILCMAEQDDKARDEKTIEERGLLINKSAENITSSLRDCDIYLDGTDKATLRAFIGRYRSSITDEMFISIIRREWRNWRGIFLACHRCDDAKAIYNRFVGNGQLLGKWAVQTISRMLDDGHAPVWIYNAIAYAFEANKFSWRYVHSVLSGWIQDSAGEGRDSDEFLVYEFEGIDYNAEVKYLVPFIERTGGHRFWENGGRQ